MELKELWRKQKLKGVFVQTVDSPAMPLIAQQAGMDFIFYDCEHGSFTYDKLTNLILLGNGRGFPSIVEWHSLRGLTCLVFWTAEPAELWYL